MIIYPKSAEELERFYIKAAGDALDVVVLKTTTSSQALAISLLQAQVLALTPDAYIDVEIDDVAYKIPVKLP